MKFFNKNINTIIFYLFYVISILIILYLINYYFNYSNIERFSNKLTFKNTDHWDHEFTNMKNSIQEKDKLNLLNLTRIPYPINSSAETAYEIQDIKKKQSLLTEKQIQDIKNQVDGDHNIALFTKNPTLHQKISYNLDHIIGPIVMNLKHEYNRARPYKLDTSIYPVIKGPGHPSYPSGHSTECYYIAYCMSKINPSKTNKYMNTAKYIAENREYGGVHYKSDTEYGKLLGKELSIMYPL